MNLESWSEINGTSVTEEKLHSVPVFATFGPHNQECLLNKTKTNKQTKKSNKYNKYHTTSAQQCVAFEERAGLTIFFILLALKP